ncbi:MAG: glycosyl transferase group 1 [Bacteroidetes bacterium]|nr:glycosyl transferase group 1 [Bacteroidota bacterium]
MDRIVIDGRTLTGEITGVANFLKLGIQAMSKVKGNNIQIFILTPKALHNSLADAFAPNVEVIKCPLFNIEFLPKLIWLFVMIPLMIRTLKAKTYYSPTPSIPFLLPSDVFKIITVHDVVNLEFAETMRLNNRISNFLIFKRSLKKADLIWANSYYTKEKVENYFPERKSKTIFVGCSIDTAVFKNRQISSGESSSIKEKYGIRDKFILFVGSLEPRKNLSFLLSLMPELYSRAGIQLLVVGAKGWKNSEISNIVNEPSYPKDSTCFAGYIETEELVSLYNMAGCFVSASLNEGFGMPQLEALFCGCPVISPRNSAMIEVVEGYGIMIECWDKEEWLNIIIDVVKKERKKIYNKELSEKYNWQNIVIDLFLQIGALYKKTDSTKTHEKK